jgi:cation-transporting P-type ATPase E
MVDRKRTSGSSQIIDNNKSATNTIEKKKGALRGKASSKSGGLKGLEKVKNKEAMLQSIREKPTQGLKGSKDLKTLQDEENVSKKKRKKHQKEEIEIVRYYDIPILEGLSQEVVDQRIAMGLVNKTADGRGKTIPGIILKNMFTFFNLLFLSITIVLIINRSYTNLYYLTTVIPNLIIGIVQEIKAKKQIDRLSLLSSPTTTVIRGGEKIEIYNDQVVLDDVVFFSTGKQISSDSIVLEGIVEANEALLTGESDAIGKGPGKMLLSGSFVVSGACVARVDRIGKDNYIEKLSRDAKKYSKPKSELLRSLNWIIKIISVIIVPLGIMTFLNNQRVLGDTLSGDILFHEAFVKTAGSVIAMIPAGLFLLTTMALAVSVIRLAKNNTLVQELYCIEMLARVNVLCLDKTGTITDGTMKVVDSIEIKNHTDYTVREIIGSMMSAFEESNPTSEALIRFFDKNKVLKPTDTIPFSSKRKFSAVTFEHEGTFLLGAPEFILMDQYDRVQQKVERFSSQGNRVLVLAHTSFRLKPDETPRNAKPIALIVIQDHIREDAPDTIAYFKSYGVDVKVISGDNPMTVSDIAQRVGIEQADRFISLDGMTDEQVRAIAFEYTVFGRVSPDQKRILVKAFKDQKKTVAMTGDGVNDILALKEADISIAMASGSEATKYVSHLVLMDSNFASMPKVVAEGRRVINNIQRTSTLFLVKTVFAVMLSVLYLLISQPYPFQPNQFTLIEWYAVGVPAFWLALQPNKELVKGRFISNVLKTTIPGALTVFFFHFLMTQLKVFGIFEALNDPKTYTTIAMYITTAVMFLVLFNVSKPFNWFRRLLFVTMIIMCIITIYFFSDSMDLGLQSLEMTELLLTIIFIQFAYPMMWLIGQVLKKLRIVPQ